MKAVSDSTPLIHLSKIGCLNFLKELFEEIIIPKAIYEEVIIKGKTLGKNEIILIEKLIEEGFIITKESKSKIELENLDKGERECIALCKELNINNILIDEKQGFKVSLMFNLTPIRTTSILIILLDRKIITFSKYKDLLKELPRGGYFLDALTYEKLLKIGENLVK
ncbi:MAG: DUF3368 domain-containing protein [Nanoarchaeota archaeon]|nr:DUF3368 domain-containing protein [Nanoarchaeota archaeon]